MDLNNLEEWMHNSNDVFEVNLTRAGKNVFDEPFHPTFTYAIFGDEETIFGYEDLELKLNFRAHDMRPELIIRHGETFPPIGDVKPFDIKESLRPFLPDYCLETDSGSNGNRTSEEDTSWKPPGKLIHSYSQAGKQFEIWCAGLTDPAAKGLLRRMQILIPFFIEGGTCQNLDDQEWTMERWKIFLIYDTTPSKTSTSSPPYTFVGFSTAYRLWVFPTAENSPFPPTPPKTDLSLNAGQIPEPYDPLQAPSRERISQFLILPPYQGQSHGTHLYNAMVSLFLADKWVFEFTVEDPNEAFDDLRDWCDLARLRADPTFADLNISESIPDGALAPEKDIPTEHLLPLDTLTQLRRKYKISPRQFKRVVEMQLLSRIPARHRSTARITRREKSGDANDRRYFFWRLVVMERLYLHNLDQLVQLEVEERREKVKETLVGVEADYERLLEGAEKRGAFVGLLGAEAGATGRKRKLRVVDLDESEESEEDVEVASKKSRVESVDVDE